MKTFACAIALSLLGHLPSFAQTSPADLPLKEDSITPITVELKQAPRFSEIPVFSSQKDADATVGTYHYKLYLPVGYNADPAKQWPCFFVMSTSGNASMADVGAYAKANGFIVVMLQEAKNGPWAPIMGNFLAAHDDAIKRVRIGQKFAVGHSGGARASSIWVQLRPGFQGLIMEGAGGAFDSKGSYHIGGIKRQPQLRMAMTMGNADPNKHEVPKMDKLFTKNQLLILNFQGGHVWAPADVFEKAMTWVTTKGPATGAAGTTSFDEFFKKNKK